LDDVCSLCVSSVVGRWQLRSADSGTLVVRVRSARLFCVGPGHMEPPPRRTADFITVHLDVRKKTQKPSAAIGSMGTEGLCLTGAIYRSAYSSFIHSFNHSSKVTSTSFIDYMHYSYTCTDRSKASLETHSTLRVLPMRCCRHLFFLRVFTAQCTLVHMRGLGIACRPSVRL